MHDSLLQVISDRRSVGVLLWKLIYPAWKKVLQIVMNGRLWTRITYPNERPRALPDRSPRCKSNPWCEIDQIWPSIERNSYEIRSMWFTLFRRVDEGSVSVDIWSLWMAWRPFWASHPETPTFFLKMWKQCWHTPKVRPSSKSARALGLLGT